MTDLRPCPFCGGEVSITYCSADNVFSVWHKYDGCKFKEPMCIDGEYAKSLADARNIWNNRFEMLKEQPKPKSAHWVKMSGMMPPEFTGHFECDNCGWHGKPFVREIDFAYCPGCGAAMSIDGLHADNCKKTPFDQILKDFLEASGGVVKV